MGLFGFSGSSSKSRSSGQSQATSSSFGASEQGATSGSLSGGASRSANQATGQSRERIAFEDVFSRLFKGAEGAAGGLDPSLLTEASNQLFSGGTDFLSSIGGDAGTAFLTERLANRDSLEADQVSQLKTDIGKLFNEELLPGITSDAVAGGQLGGGRQGVAEGKALEAAAEAFKTGSLDIRATNQAQLDALAAGVAGRGIQGAQVGLTGLSDVAGIAEMGFGADLRGAQLLSGILGGPTVLGESASQSTGFSSAEDFARAFSESFGRSISQGQSQSTSSTKSSSKSKSAGLKFGGI